MNVLEEMIIDNVVEQLKSNRAFLLKYGIIKAGVGDEKHITPEIRLQLWKQFVDTTEPLVSSFTRSLGALFIRQEEATLNNINLNPPPIGKMKLTEEQQHFIDLWFNDREKWELEFATVARPHIEGAIIAGGINALNNLDVAIPLNVTDTAILDYVKTQASRLSFEVNETTYNALRTTLTEALQNGESVLQVRDRVQNIFHFSEKWRATRIAQTEMNGAVNKGAYEGNRQSGVVWGTQWIGALDDRIRDSHEQLTLDETAVPLGEDFPIVDIPYPGCPDGAPEEVINCFIDGQIKVLTNNGRWKQIKNIKPDDYVLTHQNRFQRVALTNRIFCYSGDVVKIKLSSKQFISATPEHRFLMEDGNWKEIQDMQVGDKIQFFDSHKGYCSKPIISVERHKLKIPRTLFNFSVENDESYMIRGFYAHNCRCTTKPLTEGPNGEQPEPYIPEIQAWTPAKTVEEAELYAKETLGIENKSKLNLQALNIINERITELKSNWECTLKVYGQENGRAIFARTSYGMIDFNSKYFNSPSAFTKLLENATSEGFHPIRCNTIKSIIDHEFAHVLSNTELINLPSIGKTELYTQINKIKNTYIKEMNKIIVSGANVPESSKAFISHYAKKNIEEFTAESFSMVLNNSSPSPYAQQVFDIVKERFGK